MGSCQELSRCGSKIQVFPELATIPPSQRVFVVMRRSASRPLKAGQGLTPSQSRSPTRLTRRWTTSLARLPLARLQLPIIILIYSEGYLTKQLGCSVAHIMLHLIMRGGHWSVEVNLGQFCPKLINPWMTKAYKGSLWPWGCVPVIQVDLPCNWIIFCMLAYLCRHSNRLTVLVFGSFMNIHLFTVFIYC